MAAAGGGEANPGTAAERQSIQLSKSTLKGLECQFYGSNTFDTFYPDPSKHKFCPEGKASAYVLVQDLPESIFKLADRSLSDFESSDLEKFFDKHLPSGIRRPKCKVGTYEVEEQSGGGSSNKRNVVTGIAEFESAAVAEEAITAMNSKGPRKIMTKDDPDVAALQQVHPPPLSPSLPELLTSHRTPLANPIVVHLSCDSASLRRAGFKQQTAYVLAGGERGGCSYCREQQEETNGHRERAKRKA
jgi:hypothetical protein